MTLRIVHEQIILRKSNDIVRNGRSWVENAVCVDSYEPELPENLSPFSSMELYTTKFLTVSALVRIYVVIWWRGQNLGD